MSERDDQPSPEGAEDTLEACQRAHEALSQPLGKLSSSIPLSRPLRSRPLGKPQPSDLRKHDQD